MNGFVDTLVARTLGPGAPGAVRPHVRSLFEPEAESALARTPPIEEGTEPALAAEQSPRARWSVSQRETPPAQAQHAMHHRAETERAAPLESPVSTPAVSASMAQPQEQLQTPMAAPTPLRATQPAAYDQMEAPHTQAQLARGEQARADRQRTASETPSQSWSSSPPGNEQPHPDAAAARGAPVPAQIPVATAEKPPPPAPASLAAFAGALQPAPLPPRETVPRLLVPTSAKRLRERPSGQPDQGGYAAPSVHVSIGRIEIRATTPPRAPARKESTAPQPIGLDDYLRQRARGDRP